MAFRQRGFQRVVTGMQLLFRAGGYRLADVARDLGISRSHLSNVAAGTRRPSEHLRRRLEVVLGASVASLTRPAAGTIVRLDDQEG
jgi:transcriptional regulator with XRE-family HTH domain